MSILCWLFGHKAEEYGSQLRIADPYHDGIGRGHRTVTAQCVRCDQWYRVGGVIDPKCQEPKEQGR